MQMCNKKNTLKVRFRAILSKKVGRVFTTQPTLTTNIISVNLYMIKPKLMFLYIRWREP